ncbi:hypothetical protein [Halorussus aquaticus]|uniref:Uncharacterized protein n=1 Tax=Halorussus aquaticus TaxID=2953748 RepID=A0ABD5Q5J3_9EURY|nr:hypothetical protein [Halorussus aquaticus]
MKMAVGRNGRARTPRPVVNTKSEAIDRAAGFYITMAGVSVAVPKVAFVESTATAERRGNVTSEESAEMLATGESPVEAELSWSVGE